MIQFLLVKMRMRIIKLFVHGGHLEILKGFLTIMIYCGALVDMSLNVEWVLLAIVDISFATLVLCSTRPSSTTALPSYVSVTTLCFSPRT